MGRDEHQGPKFHRAFGRLMDGAERFFEIARDLLVERLVLFLLDIALAAQPDGLAAVDGFFYGRLGAVFFLFGVDDDRMVNEVAVFLDDFSKTIRTEKFFGIIAQVQDDIGATGRFFVWLDGVIALPFRLPFNAVFQRPGHTG